MSKEAIETGLKLVFHGYNALQIADIIQNAIGDDRLARSVVWLLADRTGLNILYGVDEDWLMEALEVWVPPDHPNPTSDYTEYEFVGPEGEPFNEVMNLIMPDMVSDAMANERDEIMDGWYALGWIKPVQTKPTE